MRRDLIQLISEQKGLRHILVLTHNIDFVFVETLLLGAMRRCGAPSLTVFADAQCAADTYQAQRRVISQLGRRYRVASVSMEPGFRFHPKAVLMVAQASATLLVGSGNLTFGGWRDNAEVWARYSTGDGTAEFAAFRQYLSNVIGRGALSDLAAAEVEDAFDSSRHVWAKELSDAGGLLGRCGKGQALLPAIARRVGDGEVDRLTVCSPYFDPEGDALEALTESPRISHIELLVAREGANLTTKAVGRLRLGARLRGASGQPRDDAVIMGPFLHAKLYAFQRDNEATVFLGSANCSRAALLSAGAKGNAELLGILQLTGEEFTLGVLAEIHAEDQGPSIDPIHEPDTESVEPATPRIVAAHLDNGLLRVAFSCPDGWTTLAALVDGSRIPIQTQSVHTCSCAAPTNTRSVRLVGLLNGQELETLPYWVDDEAALAVKASQRTLEGEIRRRSAGSEWDLGDWQGVVKLFCEHLEDAPTSRRFIGEQTGRTNESRHFTRDQVFPSQISWPARRATGPAVGIDSKLSFPELLLRWFLRAAQGESDEVDTTPTDVTHDPANDAEEPVDLPVARPPAGPRKPRTPTPLSAADRRKAEKLLRQIVLVMASDLYFTHRHPKDLAQDLKITALVLALARAKGWLEPDVVVEATCAIWVPLFLAGEGGALGRHWQTDRKLTEESLRSSTVAAALFAWSLALSEQPSSPLDAQAWLIFTLSVSRHPWIWGIDSVPAVADEVEQMLAATGEEFSESEIGQRWNSVGLQGHALHSLELILATKPLAAWGAANPQSDLPAGTLVWQGTLGYFVTQKESARREGVIPCLPIEAAASAPIKFKAERLNPISGLLDLPEIKGALASGHIAALRRIVEAARGAGQPRPKSRLGL